MKKIFIIFLLVILTIFNCAAFGHPKKIKCSKPIYFFENVNKATYFTYLDNIIQKQQLQIVKFYPELGFVSVKYKTNKLSKEPEIVTFNLKQYGNDVYLFIDISKGNTSLEKNVYAELKKHSKNSYLIKDDLMCRDMMKDNASINRNRRTTVKETVYNPNTYKINIKRYVGYDKKTYVMTRIIDFLNR